MSKPWLAPLWRSPLAPGAMAPAFSLIASTGQTVTLNRCVGRQGLTIVFFASHFLKQDKNTLVSLIPEHNEAHPVVGISSLNWETLFHLGKALELSYPLLFDPCCRVSKAYQTLLIPKFVTGRTIYTLNEAGIIEQVLLF